jgi:O-antigen/teichoic acid export membrane protein
VLFGPDYAPGQWPAAVLMLSAGVFTFSLPLHVFAVTSGHDRWYASIAGAGAVLNVALNLVLIPAWGMRGAAFATLAAQTVIVGLLWSTSPHHDEAGGPDDPISHEAARR